MKKGATASVETHCLREDIHFRARKVSTLAVSGIEGADGVGAAAL
jgi:hypothetical protein